MLTRKIAWPVRVKPFSQHAADWSRKALAVPSERPGVAALLILPQ